MIRLLPIALLSASFLIGCASPDANGPTYGSAAQEARMEQDTTMGAGMGSGPNSGQGYKGNSGLGNGQTIDKF